MRPLSVALTLALAACGERTPPEPTRAQPTGPYVLVLGTAQDAGLPQIGCEQPCCQAARTDPSRRRLVTSLLLCDPREGTRWLFDATPDLREQVERAKGHPSTRSIPGPRPPLFDGVFLTHAHMGHYAGVLFLGPESYNAKSLPLYGTPSMQAFLRSQQPWSLLVERNILSPRPLPPEQSEPLAADLSVTPLLVPHRDEFTDTCAFVLRGPRRALLYLPDIDKWDRWERSIEQCIAEVDYALLDGAFFADGEIPGRAMADIPHPFIVESMQRFASLPDAERDKIWFTHLNHTNPAAWAESDAASQVTAAGMHVLADGDLFEL